MTNTPRRWRQAVAQEDSPRKVIVVGASGFLGTPIVERCLALGRTVVAVDRRPTRLGSHDALITVQADLLLDEVDLPPGPVVLAVGNGDPSPIRPWQLVLDTVVATARLLPAISNREVTFISWLGDFEASFGLSASSQEESSNAAQVRPWDDDEFLTWAHQVAALADAPCPPWRAAPLCRRLADADPSGRTVAYLAAQAVERLLTAHVGPGRLTVLRVPEVFGVGQDRSVARLVRRALAGLPPVVPDGARSLLAVHHLSETVADVVTGEMCWAPGTYDLVTGRMSMADVAAVLLDELGTGPPAEVEAGRLPTALRAFARQVADGCQLGGDRVLPVVVPPRPERPDEVAERTQACLWSGRLKAGRWGSALNAALRDVLRLEEDRALVLTASGSGALRLSIVATAGLAAPGDVAVLPSFTFAATGEILSQLGYRLRFCDVRLDSWTLDPDRLEQALAPGDVRVVVAVDALGAPVDYDAISTTCRRHGVPFVADSAPALGASYRGRPVGTQADAHAYSMSFAKVVSAGGGGGAAAIPVAALERLRHPLDWTRSTPLGEIAAAVALDQVNRLDELMARRQAVADVYSDLELLDSCVVPQRLAADDQHAWVHWVARFEGVDRDRLGKELDVRGIGTKPYYSPAMHTVGWDGLAEEARWLPVTDLLNREALALPMSSELSVADAERVTWSVLAALKVVQRDSP